MRRLVPYTLAALVLGAAFWLGVPMFVGMLDGLPLGWVVVLAWLPFVLLVAAWLVLIRLHREGPRP